MKAKVFVYVEGPSDKQAMAALLRPLLEAKQREEKFVTFVPTEGKEPLLSKFPIRAADFLWASHQHQAVILPDLYPLNMGGPHASLPEMRTLLYQRVEQRLRQKKGLTEHELQTMLARFHVFCFKYDLESLLLSAEPQLFAHLGRTERPAGVADWNRSVEQQNNNRPPKRVVEDLFTACGMHYRGSSDAAYILGQCQYATLAERCPEGFGAFAGFLQSL